jgi:hypothetical protein
VINNHYQLYVEAVLDLAETIVVKFEDVADAINVDVQRIHGYNAVDAYDPYSWKYYQNISGRYHFSDAAMEVASLDTPERIAFTVANLAIHRATRAAYAYGTRYYHELVLQYPEQELLILGVLYPADIQKAVEADNGTILTYPKTLVESTEYTLIDKLQVWVRNYLDRWVNRQFALSDDLYTATYVGQFYLHLVPAILNLRLQACKTNEVHSFHVRQYLASHSMLDAYLDVLTRKQALFFYRNISYIQRNAGKRDTFDWLVEHVMTERNLPLYAYSMSHDVQSMQRITAEDITGLLPQVIFKRKPLNPPAQQSNLTSASLVQVLTKVAPLAIGNPAYQSQYDQVMHNALAYAPSSTISTKMVESSVVDYTDAVSYSLTDILFNHWIHWAVTQRYMATVSVALPRTGATLRLEAQDAVALFAYALVNALSPVGTPPLLSIPAFHVSRVIREATLQSVARVTSPKYLGAEEVQEIFDTRVPVPYVQSIADFYAKCQDIFTSAQLQYVLYCSKENQHSRGQAQAAVDRLYCDENIALHTPTTATGMLYETWLVNKGLSFPDFTNGDYYDLASALLASATGMMSAANASLGQLQKAMVSLFTKLSSYSIQVVTEINASNLQVVPTPVLRLGDAQVIEQVHQYVEARTTRIIYLGRIEAQHHAVDLIEVQPLNPGQFAEVLQASFDLTLRVTSTTDKIPYLFGFIPVGMRASTSWDFTQQAAALSLLPTSALTDMYHRP